ncbi:MAG: MBL fold metallo-hydrolase [Burkholderiales bacterium]
MGALARRPAEKTGGRKPLRGSPQGSRESPEPERGLDRTRDSIVKGEPPQCPGRSAVLGTRLASFLRRAEASRAPAIPLNELPHIDAALVSHSHFDHLDAPSVAALAKQPGGAPVLYAGSGLEKWFANLSAHRELRGDGYFQQPH